jgi:hypothetical protein
MDQTPQQPEQEPQIDFKPNIYPIMYWAIAYGAMAGIALFLLNILSQFLGALWAPVFLVGLVWGGYRQYQRQKAAWRAGRGISATPTSAVDEFKQAVGDVVNASREMLAENRAQDEAQSQAAAEQELAEQQEIDQNQQPPTAAQ